MSIFKRRDQGDVGQQAAAPTSPAATPAGQPMQTRRLTPPFVPPVAPSALAPVAPPGVVPPPAAPIYAFVEEGGVGSVAEKVHVTADSQPASGVRERVHASLEHPTAAPASATGVRRRPVQRAAVPVGAQRQRARDPHDFDPRRAAQTGLLNLAWAWQEAGAPIRAIHAYMQLLTRYPDTPAAAAAVADLVELSDKLAEQGQFHIALGIYDELEELLA